MSAAMCLRYVCGCSKVVFGCYLFVYTIFFHSSWSRFELVFVFSSPLQYLLVFIYVCIVCIVSK
jgi:hypothetical protein